MYEKMVQQYGRISEELEKEKNEELDEIISSVIEILALEQEPQEIPSGQAQKAEKPIKQHDKNVFALLCLRIAVNCQLIDGGHYVYQGQLMQDISQAVEKVKSIEYKWETDNAVISDALEVMLAFCPACQDILKTHAANLYNTFHWNYGEITPDLYYLFRSVAGYYRQRGWKRQAVILVERLCSISRKRNSLGRHRELVVKMLSCIGEDAVEAICRIGAADVANFENTMDEYTGDFFWFYACALAKVGEPETAGKYFEKCYKIRKVLYGRESWYTAVAKREYTAISFCFSSGESERRELLSFIGSIENDEYEGIDESLLETMAGKTLFIVLREQTGIRKIPEYGRYLRMYEEICDKYDNTDEPLLKKQLAKNLRGLYWLELGDYMQAEALFQEALRENAPSETAEIITRTQIKCNLLMAYYIQNDIEMAYPLLLELLELIEEDENEEELKDKDIYRIYAIMVGMQLQCGAELEEEGVDWLKDIVQAVCEDVQENKADISEYAMELAIFFLYAVEQIIQNECASMEEQRVYLSVLAEIERDMEFFSLDVRQKVLLYFVMACLNWNFDSPETEIYLKNCVALSDSDGVSQSMKVSVLQAIGAYFGKRGKYRQALDFAERSLRELTFAWQPYVRYLNDERLIQILNPTQLLFGSCYAVVRKHADVETAYEKVLQFKALASLAGRERNRILRNEDFDKRLLDDIKSAQDTLALLEAEQILRNTVDKCAQERAKLRSLEAEFARQFQKGSLFTDISLAGVKAEIPDNVVVIEYFFCALDYGIQQFEEQKDYTGIDIYIMKKKDGQCIVKRFTIPDGQAVLEDASEFINILQAESNDSADMGQIYEKDDIRGRLYQKLIAPCLPYIQGTELLYIAPEYGLVNLPFEILSDEEGERLGDAHKVIKIECARDFLFNQSDHLPTKGGLVIGNPQYEIEAGKLGVTRRGKEEKRRVFTMEADDINQLPFSELEVQLVGKHSRSRYYSGMDASKSLILTADGYRNIHIATHGYFDLADMGKTIYSSCLLLSGVKNWLKTGEISEVYGNGIITADEVSRLDLRSVELAVLSSCFNGMSEITGNKGFHGMVGALSAAGVHYVISHLWSADDFGTAVLMDMFYYMYIEKKQTPPEALRLAKNYLRNVTIEHLRKQKWFAYIKEHMPELYSKKMIQVYESYDDQVRPFKSESYWGGFSCYRCN